jgi:hypothetical protein
MKRLVHVEMPQLTHDMGQVAFVHTFGCGVCALGADGQGFLDGHNQLARQAALQKVGDCVYGQLGHSSSKNQISPFGILLPKNFVYNEKPSKCLPSRQARRLSSLEK